MKITTDSNELNDYEKKHALKLIKEMLMSIENIETSFILFCTDEDNKVAALKVINSFKIDNEFDGEVDEAVIFLSIFKAKLMSEYTRLNTSINQYN